MNRFVHRILKSSTASSITKPQTPATQQLIQEIQNAKLLYFGEFHSESRIVSFQTDLIREWSKNVSNARLHLIMEHFSIDMQGILNKYAGTAECTEDDNEAFEELLRCYKDFGTEGHDLIPYRDLLQFCRDTTKDSKEGYSQIFLHGGFIPRNHAARLNKECPDLDSKKVFFDEMSNRGYLPKEGDAMYHALFDESFKLRGTREHQLLIQSLMSGMDLYTPSDVSEDEDKESPISRLYQAQLLKDHAMGYKIASLMLDHYEAGRSLSSDRYIIIAGFGHLKHYLGVPNCVNEYLRQEALMHPSEQRRAAALDLLLSNSQKPLELTGMHGNKFGGRGSAMIGCQMMYEAYLEDTYPPMIEALKEESEDDDEEEEEDDSKQIRGKLLKNVYLNHPTLLDEYILKSHKVSGPLLNYANGIAGFDHPCADYLFIYDEDDENIITESDFKESQCPFNKAKNETMEAYEEVGKTAFRKGSVAKARAIMSQIGYTQEDMEYIGEDDLYNFQGVANPHTVARIQKGEVILDIGSGLGIDSFLAMRDCGADSLQGNGAFVVGVDLADSEVRHATKRASARRYDPNRIQFIRGDVEKLEEAFASKNISMSTFDVCISNGAYCLVPDKAKAFANVFKALKPGGRMAISTTTIVSQTLDPSFEWPVCMRMFASLESIQPMCEEIGFKNVQIIDAESPMEGIEIPMEEGDECRFKIHGKYADQYSFLEKMDMDKLCKVVTVYGEKP